MNTPLFYDTFESPVGTLYLTFSGKLLTGISFQKPSDIPFKRGSAPKRFTKEFASYFEGTNKDFTQEVKFLTGTDFEKKVWFALTEIPYGETRSYKWVAEKIGSPKAARAIGQAVSKNPVPVIVPCHRVIASDGSIGGYSLGVNIKKRLLAIESRGANKS